MAANRQEMEELFSIYEPTITNPEDRAAFDEFVDIYRNDWLPAMDEISEHGLSNDVEGAKAALTAAAPLVTSLDELSTKLQDINLADGAAAVQGNTDLFMMMTIVEIAVLAVAIAVALILAFYISGLISKPLATLTSFMKRAGTQGDITVTEADQATIAKYGQNKDETGQCISATASFLVHITNISEMLGHVAVGDLTKELATLSEKDVMGVSLKKMLESLNKIFGEINSASNQVSTGSVQIADGAQLLAQGSTPQSATVEQISASVTEISEQTKHNAAVANEAKNLGDNIRSDAQQGSQQMSQMMQAVQEINDASKSIGKVIKIIDDIAFQTNILALNAAVEAARAGQHGKGFAVVADEVRSLAAKSADAAKNTNELIESSIQKAEQGALISGETSDSLERIVQGIVRSSGLIAEIAKSSDQQSVGVSQIGEAINQVSQVVQQNSATAEESAAASEEMSGQAAILNQLVSRFKLKGAGMRKTVTQQGFRM
jgi:methyl-accepting chemotaxis protein